MCSQTFRPRRSKRSRSHRTDPNDVQPFIPDAVYTLKQRYFVSDSYGGNAMSFTFELPQCPFGIAYAADGFILPFKAIRLAKVEIWSNHNPNAGMTANTISLTCKERRTVRPIEWTDSATYHKAAHISKKFNKLEPLGLWYSTTSGESNPEITIQMGKGAVCELTFCYILSDGENCAIATGSSLSYPLVYANLIHADLLVMGKTHGKVIAM